MLTLALDTATKVCAVGLVKDGRVVAEYDISVGLTHSEGLIPQVDQLFPVPGLKRTDRPDRGQYRARFFYGTADRFSRGGSDGLCLAV